MYLQFRSRCHWPHLVINRHAVRPRHVDGTASTSCTYQTGLIRQHRRQDWRDRGGSKTGNPTENYVQHPHEVEPTPGRRVRQFAPPLPTLRCLNAAARRVAINDGSKANSATDRSHCEHRNRAIRWSSSLAGGCVIITRVSF